jgi:protein N-terminal methyltransferase
MLKPIQYIYIYIYIATVQGVLGGFESISPIDCSTSISFMKDYIKGSGSDYPVANQIQNERACDCGAGIGRVSAGFLLQLFDQVDLVEPNQAFLDEAKKHIANSETRVGKYIAKGLQEFNPEEGRYDLIWCQWVLGHLKDDDLVDFFKRCKLALASRGGLLGVKENVTKSGIDLDEVDSSVTRYVYQIATD